MYYRTLRLGGGDVDYIRLVIEWKDFVVLWHISGRSGWVGWGVWVRWLGQMRSGL